MKIGTRIVAFLALFALSLPIESRAQLTKKISWIIVLSKNWMTAASSIISTRASRDENFEWRAGLPRVDPRQRKNFAFFRAPR